jgi:peptide/nickel transport system permease protein
LDSIDRWASSTSAGWPPSCEGLGFSFSDGRPVLDRIVERLPASIELLAASLVLALSAAIPAGIVAAVTRRSFVDRSISAVAAAGVSIPTFWLGLMVQLTFAIALGWLPSSGRGADGRGFARLQYLSCRRRAGVRTCRGVVTLLARIADRGAGAPFIAAARARGVGARAASRSHALPNALAPVAAVVLIDAALLVPARWSPRVCLRGRCRQSLYRGAGTTDYTVLMAMLMVSSVAVVVFNLIADLIHAWLDPRVAS